MAGKSHNILTGGCHCGSIRYKITLPSKSDNGPSDGIKDIAYCHCGTCRRLSGSAFLPFLEVPASSITFIKGGSLPVAQGTSQPDKSGITSFGGSGPFGGDAPFTSSTGDPSFQDPKKEPFGEITQVTMKPLRVSDRATRTFCNACGSPISMVYDGSRETVGVTAGSLDDGPTERVLTERVMGEKGVAICEGEGMEWGDVKVLVRLGRMEGNPQ